MAPSLPAHLAGSSPQLGLAPLPLRMVRGGPLGPPKDPRTSATPGHTWVLYCVMGRRVLDKQGMGSFRNHRWQSSKAPSRRACRVGMFGCWRGKVGYRMVGLAQALDCIGSLEQAPIGALPAADPVMLILVHVVDAEV